jgi:DNA-binding MarR family transcriptional regulator
MFDEGDARADFVVPMLSRSQEKLLRYLGTFPDALAQAWDVPRTVSLPGLSEAMGVVRSGLNQPLNVLLDEGFIVVRVAHVLGGGSRRRQVYHITEKGRGWLAEHPLEELVTNSDSNAGSPRKFSIIGRERELEDLIRLLAEERRVVVGGLSGVGKTTLLKAWAAQSTQHVVRWATMDSLSDAHALMQAWFPDTTPLPADPDAMIEHVGQSGKQVLVVDDLHLVEPRHLEGVQHLLHGLHVKEHTVVLAGRLPLPEGFDWPLLKLGTLDPNDAKEVLGDHLDENLRLEVAKALDGHPMALNLYREGDQLPEAGEDIQAFVEQTMLDGLDEEALEALDGMVLFPRPLPAAMVPGASSIDDLDERALLRWTEEDVALEIQHLIRNVRRTMLDEKRLMKLHQAAADHWANHLEEPAYAVLHLYHTMALDDDHFVEEMVERFDALMLEQSGAMAVIFDRATVQRPDRENLHYWAGRIAIHRQEADRARHHLSGVESESLRAELAYELARIEGDEQEAERLLRAQLAGVSDTEGVRWILRAAVQRIDDRVFDQAVPVDDQKVQSLLNQVRLPDDLNTRASITVSITLIQLTMALLQHDEARVQALVEGLEALSHTHDPIVLHAKFKANLAFGKGTHQEQRDAYDQAAAAQTTSFHTAVVGLTFAEHLVGQGHEFAGTVHASLPNPSAWAEAGSPGHRYAARWWYLKGHLEPEASAPALREAARCFRQAGCTNAARAVTQRLHRVL